MVNYVFKEFKTILNKLKFPDSWFWCKYTINPYSGCEHACIYCDARSNRYYLQEIQDFENEVIIKTYVDKKLDLRIKRARSLLPDVVAMGGVNDAYQPIEIKAKNTQKILKVFAKFKFPVSVSTKSNLFIRDIDLFNKIANDTWFTIAVSITTMNEELSRFLEPFSSTPQERLEALKKVKENAPNVQVGVNLMPVIPYICDSKENMEEIVRKSKEVGIDFILFGGLTLRDSQKDFFIKKLKNSKHKDFILPLLDLYSGNKNIWSDYNKKLNKKILDLRNRYEISIRTKRWIPDKEDYRKWNYKISELLLNKVYLDNLKTGKSNKTMMWAGLNLNNLEESILDVYKRGELSKLRNFKPEIIKYVKPYLDKTKELRQRKGLDKFL